MAWTTPRTWVTGNVLTAAQLNTDIRDNSNFLYTPPCVSVTKSAVQALTTGVSAACTFDGEAFDTDTMHDNVTNNTRLTAKTAGRFLVIGLAQFAANNTGHRIASVVNNAGTYGGTTTSLPAVSPIPSAVPALAIIPAAVNDYFVLNLVQTSGGNLDALTTTTFAAHWLSN